MAPRSNPVSPAEAATKLDGDGTKPAASTHIEPVPSDSGTSRRSCEDGKVDALDQDVQIEKTSWLKGGFFEPITQLPLTWISALVTIVLFFLTVYYALTSGLGKGIAWTYRSQSNVILLLRVLSEATGLFLTFLVAGAMERLQWMLVARTKGLKLPTLLSLEAGTGAVGLLQLLFLTGYKLWTRLSSLGRLFLKLLVPALGVLVMSQVTTETTFEPITSFSIAAGIGKFTPEYAQSYSIIAGIYFATDITNLLSNPQRVYQTTPIKPPTTPCAFNSTQKRSKSCSASYFIPGGLDLISPWPSKNQEHWEDADMYQVQDLQGYQLDFGQLAAEARFDGAKDCKTFGDSSSAFQICLVSPTGPNAEPNVIHAKFVHCPLDVSSSSNCERNTKWQASSGWTTTLRPYIRRSTTTFSRANGSIISISGPSETPRQAMISAADLLATFTASFDTSSDSITGSSSALRFVQYLSNVMIFAETSSLSYNAAGAYLRNLLALPLYYFHGNNLSPTIEPSPDRPLEGLEKELYTQASLARVRYRLRVGRATAIVYAIGGAMLITGCLMVLVAGSLRPWAGRILETTAFPVLDFVRMCEKGDQEVKLADFLENLKISDGRESREAVDVRVMLRGAKVYEKTGES